MRGKGHKQELLSAHLTRAWHVRVQVPFTYPGNSGCVGRFYLILTLALYVCPFSFCLLGWLVSTRTCKIVVRI